MAPSARMLSLCALCLNQTALVLCMKFASRGPRYSASSAVILTELGKLICSLVLGYREVHNADVRTHLIKEAPSADEVKLNGMGFSEAHSPLLKSPQTSPRRSARNQHHQPVVPSTPSRRSQRIASHGKSSSVDVREMTKLHEQLSEPDSRADPALDHEQRPLARLLEETFAQDWWKLSLPSVLFTLQANLQYVAVANLSLPVFQCTSQLKILSTALCSVFMLRRVLSRLQWTALALLAFGVALVQLDVDKSERRRASAAAETANYALGLLSVLAMCASSGFASVFFELVLKRNEVAASREAERPVNGEPPPSATPQKMRHQTRRETGLWIRNIQLSMFSLTVALVMHASSSSFGALLTGYTPLVWLVVALQICGGLIAACVIKYADNLAKNFATSLSILLSFAASMVLLDFQLDWGAVSGAAFVLSSTWLFSSTTEERARLMAIFSG